MERLKRNTNTFIVFRILQVQAHRSIRGPDLVMVMSLDSKCFLKRRIKLCFSYQNVLRSHVDPRGSEVAGWASKLICSKLTLEF